MSETHASWLKKEVPSWVKEGLVSEASAKVLLERYVQEKPRQSTLSIAFSMLGFLLVGLGIISLLAYNWDNLGRTERSILALGLLLSAQALGIWSFFYRPNERALREGSAFFWFLMVGAALAIIGQTYHLGGTLLDFLTAWLALGFLMPWLLSSTGVAIGVSVLWASVWVMNVDDNGALFHVSHLLQGRFWFLLSVFVSLATWYAKTLRANQYAHTSSLLGWSMSLSCLAVFGAEMISKHFSFGDISLLSILFFTLYYLLGRDVLSHGERFFQQPFEHIGRLGVLSILVWHVSIRSWEWVDMQRIKTDLYGDLRWGLLAGFVLLYVWALRRLAYRKNLWNGDMLIVYAPILFLLSTLIHDAFLSVLLSNTFFFAASVWMVVYATRTSRLGLLNQGMILIIFGLWIHFLDAHVGLVSKGVAFIVSGVLFLGVNALFKRRLKACA